MRPDPEHGSDPASAGGGAYQARARQEGRFWHAGAAGALLAGAGLSLFLPSRTSAQDLLAVLLMAGTGTLGALKGPTRGTLQGFLALWTLGGALACALSGGLSGPFAVFCIAPAVVALALGADWRDGLLFSLLAAVLVAGADLFDLAGPQADPGARGWLTFGALAVTALGLCGAVVAGRRRFQAHAQLLEDRLAAFRIMMNEVPELALSIGPDGRTEAVFGHAHDALPAEALQAGVVAASAPADRAAVEDALENARRYGAAQVAFSPDAAPERRFELLLRRTSRGGLAGVIRQTARTFDPAPDVSSAAADEGALLARLRIAEAARAEAETARKRAEDLAEGRARFLANMSHELRTPLNAIMGFSDMMRARMFGDLAEKYGEYADLIHESGSHLLTLINDILDVSKIEAQRYVLKYETFDAREPLGDALRLMRLQADDAGVRLRGALPAAPAPVEADKRALKQIALNLLSNAIKFTPSGGLVVLNLEVQGSELELVVVDTGVGIDAEDLERLGKPFEQAGSADDRARGSGLGLSLVTSLAHLHGGSVALESRLGEGTAVTVRLPRAPAEEAPAPAAARAAQA